MWYPAPQSSTPPSPSLSSMEPDYSIVVTLDVPRGVDREEYQNKWALENNVAGCCRFLSPREASEEYRKKVKGVLFPEDHATAIETSSALEFLQAHPDWAAKVEATLGFRFRDRSLLVNQFSFEWHSFSKLVSEGQRLIPFLSMNHMGHMGGIDVGMLARVAITNGLHRFLLLKLPEVDDFIKRIRECPSHFDECLDPPMVLVDIVKSIIGAVNIDSYYSRAKVDMVFRHLFGSVAQPGEASHRDPRVR